MACLAGFLKVWSPKSVWTTTKLHRRADDSTVATNADIPPRETQQAPSAGGARPSVMKAWMPWIILTVFVFAWGMPQVRKDRSTPFRPLKYPIPGLRPAGRPHAARGAEAGARKAAVFSFNIAVGGRHGDSAIGDRRRAVDGLLNTAAPSSEFCQHDRHGAAIAAHDRARCSRSATLTRYSGVDSDARARIRPHRRVLSVLRRRCSAGWASR